MAKRKQCAKCPWRKDVDPHQIPNGYSVELHKRLRGTIAEGIPSVVPFVNGTLRMMACHESKIGLERPCVGWLHNQLGVGNNLGLRIAAMRGDVPNYAELVIIGAQHETLEDTLPPEAHG